MIRVQWATKVVETLLGKYAFRYFEKVHLIWQGGDEDIEEGLRKFLGIRKGGFEKIRGGGLQKFVYFRTNRRGWGAPKKLNRQGGRLLKFQASSFNIFVPPLVILKELSLKDFFLIYLHLALNVWYPGPSIQCCVGAVVCAVEEIGGEGRKICPKRSKIEFYCHVSRHFWRQEKMRGPSFSLVDAHCSSKFIITSVVLDIRDRSLLMAWWGGESFWGSLEL